MKAVPATITAEVMEHADGRPVAYIDATGVVVFVWQEADGSYVVEVHTRDAIACRRPRLLLDGQLLAEARTLTAASPADKTQPESCLQTVRTL